MDNFFKKIGSYFIIGLIYMVSIMPYWILYGISDYLYFIVYKVVGYRKKVVIENLTNSFPEKSRDEILKIASKFYHNLADVMVETVKEFTISEKQIKKRFRFVNPEVFDQHTLKGKSIMMLMGHYTNWEYGVSTALWVKADCWAVYGKLENQYLNKPIVRTREKFGFKLFPMEDTYKVMLEHENSGKLYMFMADQTPHHAKIKYWLNFLNQETPVHIGAEKLARMKEMAVVFIDIQRVKRGYYEIKAQTLFDDAAATNDYEITRKYFEVLESVINKEPSNWLWSHKRWKYKKGVNY